MNLLLGSKAGQPRGDGDYLKNLDSVGAAPPVPALDLCYDRDSFYGESVNL